MANPSLAHRARARAGKARGRSKLRGTARPSLGQFTSHGVVLLIRVGRRAARAGYRALALWQCQWAGMIERTGIDPEAVLKS